MVALTGRNEAYYTDYLGKPQEFISAVKYGYLYQGQHYKWQKQRRGTAGLHMPPASKVIFIQNHDQVANSAYGARCHQLTDPGRMRAMTALLLLAPGTPMLFQGQEFGASSPFLYFADHQQKLAETVLAGRATFLAQFRSLATPEMSKLFADPSDPATFERCKLDHTERETHAPDLRTCIATCCACAAKNPYFARSENRAWMARCSRKRHFSYDSSAKKDDDRLLLVNFGIDLHSEPRARTAACSAFRQRMGHSLVERGSEIRRNRDTAVETDVWQIPGHAAVVLKPERVA